MTMTASRDDAEDLAASARPETIPGRVPVTSPTHDPWNPHRHVASCWWDHRDARWVCREPEAHLRAPARAPDESGDIG